MTTKIFNVQFNTRSSNCSYTSGDQVSFFIQWGSIIPYQFQSRKFRVTSSFKSVNLDARYEPLQLNQKFLRTTGKTGLNSSSSVLREVLPKFNLASSFYEGKYSDGGVQICGYPNSEICEFTLTLINGLVGQIPSVTTLHWILNLSFELIEP